MTALVADTSAFVSIFLEDEDSAAMEAAITSADKVVIPASCMVEAALLFRIGRGFYDWFSVTTSADEFELADISADVAAIATSIARQYGKGSGHPAQLNFGDCLVYGVAIEHRLPLLCTGNDFAKTPLDLIAR